METLTATTEETPEELQDRIYESYRQQDAGLQQTIPRTEIDVNVADSVEFVIPRHCGLWFNA